MSWHGTRLRVFMGMPQCPESDALTAVKTAALAQRARQQRQLVVCTWAKNKEFGGGFLFLALISSLTWSKNGAKMTFFFVLFVSPGTCTRWTIHPQIYVHTCGPLAASSQPSYRRRPFVPLREIPCGSLLRFAIRSRHLQNSMEMASSISNS